MRQIIWNHLNIELTRRCNMHCAHCFKGDAQDKDISNDVIDGLLDNTVAIYHLGLVGAEVTLCPDRMRYLLNGLIKRNIPLLAMNFTTNGKICSPEVVQIVKDYAAYIRKFVRDDCRIDGDIHIGISFDEFHDEGCYGQGFKYYSEQLRGVARVGKISTGHMPLAFGRAEKLNKVMRTRLRKDCNGFLREIIVKPCEPKRVEYLSAKHKPVCAIRDTAEIYNESQVMVICTVMVSVSGKLYPDNHYSNQQLDDEKTPYICEIQYIDGGEHLENCLERYNAYLPPCPECAPDRTPDRPLNERVKAKTNDLTMFYYIKKYAPMFLMGDGKSSAYIPTILTRLNPVYAEYLKDMDTSGDYSPYSLLGLMPPDEKDFSMLTDAEEQDAEHEADDSSAKQRAELEADYDRALKTYQRNKEWKEYCEQQRQNRQIAEDLSKLIWLLRKK